MFCDTESDRTGVRGSPPDKARGIGDEVRPRHGANALTGRSEGLEDIRGRILVGVCEVGGVRLRCIYNLHKAEGYLRHHPEADSMQGNILW